MLAFSNDYYGMIFRATQSVELFCAYEKVALERAYIERNGCPFAIGEDKLPEKLLELKRNVGNHYEDFDL